MGETCVLATGQTAPACTGSFRCDDSDPCTADLCDPLGGACSNPAIECDDGNPCTVDQCLAGDCTSTIITGVACDDEDRCTTGDQCGLNPFDGQPVCGGVATGCDDGNACTLDACDAVTGGCGHAAMPIAPISLLNLLDDARLSWSAAAGSVAYNSYRGTIPQQGLGSRPAGARYDQGCLEAHDAAGDGPTLSTDPGVPPVRTAYYYLASEVVGCGEGPLGTDSNGTPIPNGDPCPAP
jgi:hypothetical protein